MFGLEKSVATAIGVGLLVLALIGAIIGLIKYGQKLGKLEAENSRLSGEVEEANVWKADTLEKQAEQRKALADLAKSERDAWVEYETLRAAPPLTITRWRDVVTEAPAAVPLGDCDRAATNAWDVLKEAGLIGQRTWEDTSYSPPSVQDVLDAVALEQSLTGPTLNLYLSPFQNRRWNESAGTYLLSTRPPSLVNWSRMTDLSSSVP